MGVAYAVLQRFHKNACVISYVEVHQLGKFEWHLLRRSDVTMASLNN